MHTQTHEYYSAIKKNEIMAFAAMDGPRDYLEITILSQVTQTKTNINMMSLTCGIKINYANELIYKTETD